MASETTEEITEKAPAPPSARVSMTLRPEQVTKELQPAAPYGATARRAQGPFHRVPPPVGTEVRLRQIGDATETLRIRLRAEREEGTPLPPSWARWRVPSLSPLSVAAVSAVATSASRVAPPQQTAAERAARAALVAEAALIRGSIGEIGAVRPESAAGEAENSTDGGETIEQAEVLILLPPGEILDAPLELTPTLEEAARRNWSDTVIGFRVTARREDSEEILGVAYGQLRLRHPRPHLLRYLPAIYTPPELDQDENALVVTPFFPRFLLGFEDALDPLRIVISQMERFFDPILTDPDFLPFLASWVSLSLREEWPELKRRRILREAVELFSWRGTRRSLSRWIEIFTGYKPLITDKPRTGMTLSSASLLGGEEMTLGDIPPHGFVVKLTIPDEAEVSQDLLHRIIETEKPAHAVYSLMLIRLPSGPQPDMSAQESRTIAHIAAEAEDQAL